MPSFDIVSEIDKPELSNAVDNTKREMDTRFDFNGVDWKIELKDLTVTLTCTSDFQVRQMEEVLRKHCTKRGVSSAYAEIEDEPVHSGRNYSLNMTFKEGLDQPTAKQITKLVKEKKLKVKAAIQGDKVRVEGKKRDDLQECIAMLRASEIKQDLQFNNFRD